MRQFKLKLDFEFFFLDFVSVLQNCVCSENDQVQEGTIF